MTPLHGTRTDFSSHNDLEYNQRQSAEDGMFLNKDTDPSSYSYFSSYSLFLGKYIYLFRPWLP